MTSMGEMYIAALEDQLGFGKGWRVNWPPHSNVELGYVGSFEYDYVTNITSFRRVNQLSDVGIDIGEPLVGRAGGKRAFSAGRSTKVSFGVDASLPDWSFIGSAKAGLRASFGRKGGMSAEVTNPQYTEVRNIQALKAPLLDAARSNVLTVGQVIVVGTEHCDSGAVVASEGTEGEIKATTEFEVDKAGVSLASFAADLAVKQSSGKAVTQTMPTRFTSTFRMLMVGVKGLWWWKEIVIRGVGEMTEEDKVAAAENELEPGDFFVLYDDND